MPAAKTSVVGLEIAMLRRGDRCEEGPIWLKVKEHCPVQAIEAPDGQDVTRDADERGDRCPDGVRPNRRAKSESATCRPIVGWALTHEVATGGIEPIQHFDSSVGLKPVQGSNPRLEKLYSAEGAIRASLSRASEAVCPRRMNTSDVDQPGIELLGLRDGDFTGSNFVETYHALPIPIDDCLHHHYGSYRAASRASCTAAMGAKPDVRFCAHLRSDVT